LPEKHGPKVVLGPKSVAMMSRQNYFTARLIEPSHLDKLEPFSKKQAILATDKHKTHMEIFQDIHSKFRKTQSIKVLQAASFKLFNKV
jgi:hypothetical protein